MPMTSIDNDKPKDEGSTGPASQPLSGLAAAMNAARSEPNKPTSHGGDSTKAPADNSEDPLHPTTLSATDPQGIKPGGSREDAFEKLHALEGEVRQALFLLLKNPTMDYLADPRWVNIGATHLDQAMMAFRRSIDPRYDQNLQQQQQPETQAAANEQQVTPQ